MRLPVFVKDYGKTDIDIVIGFIKPIRSGTGIMSLNSLGGNWQHPVKGLVFLCLVQSSRQSF